MTAGYNGYGQPMSRDETAAETRHRHLTQCERLLDLLRSEPSVSSIEVTERLRVVNVTGRVSDLRAKGHDVQAKRDPNGVWRYSLASENPTLGL